WIVFFFQAEDGIRDFHVTGVQTCALPISQEALAMGLINKVVPDGAALEAARELADQIAECAPLAVQGILRTYRETEHLPEEEALKISDEIGWPIIGSEDAKEGSLAFKEKRPAVYKGR